ncbi:acyl carrier protein [Corynebacterium lizhenjunii]|uniref:acyl carrier protein n=1 Tax=Corynebacterium lizhenjunii TaxID=2709394 RepID=UPI0013ED7264|nr:acyl carrier protein [Corynebacterium lizhenjunii]
MANDSRSSDLAAQLRAALGSPADTPTADAPQDVYGQLALLIARICGADVERDTQLADAPVDSLDLIELVVRCEQTFGVRIDAEAARGWVTVGDVADYIETRAVKQ